jgi:hypothetical protein
VWWFFQFLKCLKRKYFAPFLFNNKIQQQTKLQDNIILLIFIMTAQTVSTGAKTRRVRFGAMDQHADSTTNNTSTNDDDGAVHVLPPPSIFSPELTMDHKKEFWYQALDLATFRNEARFLILCGTKGERKELARYTAERMEAKKRAIKQILMVQSNGLGKDSWFMCRVSECVSINARHEALEQGYADYCEVYYCDEKDMDFPTPSKTLKIVDSMRRQPQREEDEGSKRRFLVLKDQPATRRVRQKTAGTCPSPFLRLFASVPNPPSQV